MKDGGEERKGRRMEGEKKGECEDRMRKRSREEKGK